MNDSLSSRCTGRFSALRDIPSMKSTKVGTVFELYMHCVDTVDLVNLVDVPSEHRMLAAVFMKKIEKSIFVDGGAERVMERSEQGVDTEDRLCEPVRKPIHTTHGDIVRDQLKACTDGTASKFEGFKLSRSVTRIHAARTMRKLVDDGYSFVDAANCFMDMTEPDPEPERGCGIIVDVSGEYGMFETPEKIQQLQQLRIPEHVDYVLMREGVADWKKKTFTQLAESVPLELQKKIVLTADGTWLPPPHGKLRETFDAFTADPRSDHFVFWEIPALS